MARVILQQAPTGLDTFLEEISKYASPEYQLRKRESERADARLELSRRQQEESDLRYRDSVRQQRFQNELAEDKFDLESDSFWLLQSTQKIRWCCQTARNILGEK